MTWLAAIGVAIAASWWCEHVSRAHDQRPSVQDDPVWWSLFRQRVDDDPRVVAFVGTSRMALAYSPRDFAAAVPDRRGVTLAINGVPAIGILEDLAADERFRGIAIVDIDEWDIAWGDPRQLARPYVERARALWRAPGAVANRCLGSPVQANLAMLAVGGRTFLTSWMGKRRWPAPTWVVNDIERGSHGGYDVADPAALARKREWRLTNFANPPPSPEAWLASARHIEPLVRRIRARGGDVVIVRMPVSGTLWSMFEQHYPRRLYWDAFAAESSARVLHFRDVPALASLVAPDDMHLDQRDQPRFIESLWAALRERGVLAGRP